jgi:PAS domain S-box-containing protein
MNKNLERVKLEELSENRERLRAAFENTHDAITIYTIDGKFIDCNRRALQIFGIESKAEFVHTRPHKLSPEFQPNGERSESLCLKYLAEAKTHDGFIQFEWVHKKKNGETFPAKVILTTYDIDGETYLQANIRDLSKQKEAIKALEQSEKRFRALVQNSRDIIALYSAEGEVLYKSPGFENLLGYEPDEVIGKNVLDLAHPSDKEKAAKVLQQVLQKPKGSKLHFEIRAKHKDGSYRLLEATITNLLEDENVGAVVGNYTDITEKKRNEELLQRRIYQLEIVNEITYEMTQEVDLHWILKTAADLIHQKLGYYHVGILLYNHENNTLGYQIVAGKYSEIANPDYEQKAGDGLIGKAASEMKVQLCQNVKVDPVYFVGFEKKVPTLAEIALPIIHENQVLAVLDVQETKINAFDDIDIQTLQTIVRQIAIRFEKAKNIKRLEDELRARKSAEKRLRESEQKFRIVAESSPFAIMIYQNDKWIYTNPAGEQISGYSAEELYKMNYWEIVTDEYRDLVRQRGQNRQVGKYVPQSYEFTIRSKNGKKKWVYFTGNLIEFEGKPAGLISVADVTKLKKTEKKLSEALREKETLLKELQHRVKNSMAMILSLIRLEQAQKKEERIVTALQEVEHRIKVLADLYQLLYATSAEEIKIDRFIRNICYSLAEALSAQQRVNINMDLEPLVLDAKRASSLGLIVNELLTNAFKYAVSNDKKTNINIGLVKRGENLELSVSDDGAGLPEDFDPVGSASFGLHLVEILSNQLQGTFSWENDHGARFSVSFPF